MKNFTHLHLHTEYSLLDGLSKIDQLTGRVKELNMESVAVTDHGVLYGAIEFYKQCLAEDVKPLIGVEAYLMKGQASHTERDPKKKANSSHLVLLAKNKQGYRNLMELSTIAHLEGFYYRPRFDKKTLKKYSQGLICTSACPLGEISQFLAKDKYDQAKKVVEWFLNIFKDDFYIELQRHQHNQYLDRAAQPEIRQELTDMAHSEQVVNEGLVKLSREYGIPLIATNDVHYIKQEDAEAQDALVCVSTGSTVDTIDRLRYIDTPTFYLRSPQEMSQLFLDYPEAIKNTNEIAKKCDLEITLGQWFFPKLPDLPEDQTEEQILRAQVDKLLPLKYSKITDQIKKRAEFELEVICSKGYAGYFLIMADFAEWARQQKIVTNTRGSAAGSLISYALNITTVDPLKYYLPFERFLNPYRPSPPDIDLDIADNRRMDLIDYITRRFGQDKVAQICTFGRMLARGSVRDIARVLNYPYDTGDKIAKLIPMGSQGFPMYIDRAFKESPELKDLYDHDPDSKKILDLARKVEGSARHCSVHAAAVVVAPTAITDFTPLQRESKGDKIITQYEMHASEDVGLIKFDILGITHLTILDTAINIVEQTTGHRVDLHSIPLDDQKTFDMLGRGETIGVFQLPGSGITKWLMELKPTSLEDIMAMIALYRPGPIHIIPEYIARKQGKSPVTYYHPKMKKFLEASYGLLVYQDDLLFTAIELAGYNWQEVDKFRKAVGKKIPKEMAKQHEKFVKGCIEHSKMLKAEAEDIWKLFEPFQGYGFNKAHAASYGMISYYTAYMKANYTVEYMTAMLTADAGETAKITAGVEEARKMDIQVLAPDINQSSVDFTVEPHPDSLNHQAIRFGLNAIKNVGEAAIQAIIEARKDRLFTGLSDFFSRVDNRKVNKKVMESLIKAGAFDQFGNRAVLLAAMDALRQLAEQQKKTRASGQVDLFGSLQSSDPDPTDPQLQDKLPQVTDFTPEQKLAFEKELLGFYLTDNPFGAHLTGLQLAASHRLADLAADHQGKTVKVAGIITNTRVVITKKTQKPMVFASLMDQTGAIDLIVFPQTYSQSKSYWQDDHPVLINGKVEYREEQLSLIVDRVISGNETSLKQEIPSSESQNSPTNGNGHVLVIPKGTDKNKLIALNTMLKNHPGEDGLTLIFENRTNGGRKVPVPFGIDYNKKLQKDIIDLLKK